MLYVLKLSTEIPQQLCADGFVHSKHTGPGGESKLSKILRAPCDDICAVL
jgi:hypothetical protein